MGEIKFYFYCPVDIWYPVDDQYSYTMSMKLKWNILYPVDIWYPVDDKYGSTIAILKTLLLV